MANPPKKSEQPKSKHTTKTTPSGEYPSRVSLTNELNVCYASAVVQVIASVPALRALVGNVGSLPFSNTTGRDDFAKLKDPGLLKRRLFLKRLSDFCILLETEDQRLPAKVTLELMSAMRKINKQFKLGKEDDPSALFSTIVAILNDAGDRSAPLPIPNGEMIPPTRILDRAREERIKAGCNLLSLEREIVFYRKAHLASGYDLSITRLMTLEFVRESVCSSKACPSPYTRSFRFLNVLHLSFPESDKGYDVDRAYSMNDLLGTWSQDVHRETCEHDGKKAKKTVQKIVGTPEILVLQVDRLAHTAAANGTKNFVSNPLIINETIDLREHCERRLPTEKLYHERMKSPPTKYKLRALIRHRNGHFWTTLSQRTRKGCYTGRGSTTCASESRGRTLSPRFCKTQVTSTTSCFFTSELIRRRVNPLQWTKDPWVSLLEERRLELESPSRS